MFRFAQHDSAIYVVSFRKFRGVIVLLVGWVALLAAVQAQPNSLEQLSDNFWTWRAKYAPFTGDDVNRIERPGGIRDWSRARIEQQRKDLAGFEARWKTIDPAQWPISKQVDYKLIGSALARVRWELDVNPRWKRDPNFYIAQTLTALEKFQQQLKERLPKLPQQTALGRDSYVWFLRNVALMPFTPEELLAMGRQEWNRAVAFEAYEKNRNKDVPLLKIATDVNSWIKDAADKELQIRKFLEERGILTVPDWIQHYTLRPTPEYLRSLGFTENDDFTSPSRLKENCIRYVPEPSDKLGYFWRATAMDPRPITVHEGIPGHY